MNRFHTCLTLFMAACATCGCENPAPSPSPLPLLQPQAAPAVSPQSALETEPTYTLSGVVFLDTETGRFALPGVRVTEIGSGRSSMTRNDGSYSITGLPSGSHSVSAARWDVVTYTKTLAISGDTRLDISLPTYTLSGVVFLDTDTGRFALPGVRVTEIGSGRSSMTRNDGNYSITGLPSGSHSVSATRWDVVTYTKALAISGDTRLDISLPTHTLSGVVFERTPTGTAPIEGVAVYCDGCGAPLGHTYAYTDAQGFYSLSYTYSGTNPIMVMKAGYGDQPGQAGGPNQWVWRYPMVNGDTKFDIELVKR